ncbi:hypothetical protein [Halorubrum vacuolatum]|uniref:Uncharacterized protein n=1 Tax=Halorubrum vacuolatum TaxID=63740 RepID=A0A238UPB2_HALVU|nr:hypothetical protein [Halorubrum vacuolatum]SNR23467.1 hypothetical protein SAMN06264855_101123 [Halorubrum vacuolatum]
MRFPSTDTLHRVCHRYGPGRLPGANRPDIGAGYAAATAALAATFSFASAAILGELTGILPSNDGLVWFVFASLALPVVVPAAFVVAIIVWRLLPTDLPLFGPIAGLLGTLGTYVASLLALGLVLTLSAALGFSGADPMNAAAFSFGVVVVGFTVTWWITLPVGAISATVYTAVVSGTT